MILEWNKSCIKLIALYLHPKNGNHLGSHLRAIIYMALDHSRLGLENKSGPLFCVRQVYLIYKILSTNLGACKPTFYTFLYTSHLRRKSTTRRCFYHTDLRQNAGPSKHAWAFSETVHHVYGQPVRTFDKRQICSEH